MWKLTFELLSYVGFVVILYIISYLHHQSNEYFQVQHLRRLFLNSQNTSYNYSKIVTIEQYWSWLEDTFIENIRADNWYNGQPVDNADGFLRDASNRLIGWATMRQLRVKQGTCRVKDSVRAMIPTCEGEYSSSNEERRSFYPGWALNDTMTNYSTAVIEAFIYQNSEQLDSYFYLGQHATYGSGGYVYEFRGTLDELRQDVQQLHQLSWIDRQTRAILIQMNLYNPNVPVYTSVVIVAELLPSSGVFPSSRFEPLDFDGNRSSVRSTIQCVFLVIASRLAFTSVFQIVCAFVYLAFIVYFTILEIRAGIRLKKAYFQQFWTYIEIGIMVCSWTGIGIHIWRRNEARRILTLFRRTKGDAYINFQLIAYINDIFSFLLAFCCFFGTIKLLRLCRYNRRLSLLSNTLRRARRELISFSFMFSIIFMAFLTLFYLQFASHIWDCSSLLHTAQMLFEMLLLKFDTTEFAAAEPLLGPIYFTFFILFVVFVCINMFVSIINDNFRLVRADVHKVDDDDQDLFIRFLKKLKRWWGDKERIGHVKIHPQPQIIHVAERPDPVVRLAMKVDQLKIFVDRRYGKEAKDMRWRESNQFT